MYEGRGKGGIGRAAAVAATEASPARAPSILPPSQSIRHQDGCGRRLQPPSLAHDALNTS